MIKKGNQTNKKYEYVHLRSRTLEPEKQNVVYKHKRFKTHVNV